MKKDLNAENSSILKVLSDPSRYLILQILLENGGDVCVNEIAYIVKITPSAVSHQLSKLEDLSIVSPVRKGQTVCYKLTKNVSSEKIRKIISLLD